MKTQFDNSEMGSISNLTLQKLVILNTIKQFREGVFGKTRLQKTTFMILRDKDFPYKIFKYKNWYHGAYSEEVQTSLEHLISLGLVVPDNLDSENGKGNKFILSEGSEFSAFGIVLSHVNKHIVPTISKAVKNYGYLPENELINVTKNTQEFKSTVHNDTIWEIDAPDEIEVDFNEYDLEDIELALNPGFVRAMSRLAQGISKPGIDLLKVKHIVKQV